MIKKLRLLVLIILSLSFISFFADLRRWWYGQQSFPARVQSVRTHFQNGVVLPLFSLEEDYPYTTAIDEIADLKAHSVSLFITNYQEDIRSNTIYLNLRAAEVTQLFRIIDYAHSRGLSVFLFPTLHIQHLGYKEWRGVLAPKDLELWWQNYFKLMRFYTHIARQKDVEMLSIGSELCAMESDTKRWEQIVGYARNHYRGMLTYSANWDHYHNIAFMRDMDYLGINAYFGLTQKTDPTLDEIVKAWEPARKRIEEAYKEYSKPVILTELGYPSVDGANKDPWNYFATTKIDLEEQALCYRAFVKTWSPPPGFLHGVYFYNWWGVGGPNDRDYTPRGKPAEKVLRQWYSSF
jgi:Glycoside Hydrolase Family 113